jgi:hypothetical protein
MPNIIDNFLSQLVSLLGPLSPFAKALSTAALPVAYAIVASIANGKIDSTSLVTALTGVALAVVVYFVPNKAAAAKS